MKITEVLRIGAMWAAMLGMALPTNVLGAAPTVATTARSMVRDVAKGHDGVLNGRIVDSQGRAEANAAIQFHRDGQLVANTTTDVNGQFFATNLASGEYQVTSGNARQTYRVWNAQTAPPIAATAIQLTSGDIVRGQCTASYDGCGGCGDLGCTGGCGDGCTSGGCILGGGCTGSLGCGCGGCGGGGGFLGGGGLLSSPVLIAAGIAAAIAIPIALNDDDDPPATP